MGRRSSVFHLDVGGAPAGGTAREAAPGRGVGVSASAQRADGAGIVAGVLAPHPPHLIYAENPPQNEPRSQGGWDVLRWGYEALRERIQDVYRPDVLLVHAAHWVTAVGHHVNCEARSKGVSVDPIFPHLFRYHYDFRNDVELAEAIVEEGEVQGLTMGAMRNPHMRVDYATIGALHLVNPAWDIPVVSISANNNPYFYGDASLDEMEKLGQATARAIERTGRRAVICATNSLSHLHWDVEPELPEDMACEHSYNHHQYRWDMKLLDIMREGDGGKLRGFIPEHIAATAAETKSGGLTWMLSALGWPDLPAKVHSYGTVIGTGNAVVEWDTAKVRR